MASERRAFDSEEHKVPPYALPDMLITSDGKPADTADVWRQERRPEILDLFRREVYGHPPPSNASVGQEVLAEEEALGGKAVRRQIRITMTVGERSSAMDCLLHVPAAANTRGYPLFLGLNFCGNHTVSSEPGIPVTTQWVRNMPDLGIADHKAREENRGAMAKRWPLQRIIEAGYAVATIYCGDLAPDDPEHWRTGAWQLFYGLDEERAPEQCGTIAVWAWGLSRAMDVLETDPAIDRKRVIVIGHSRLGKTALWAGAQDERFAMVVSNNSGCGGAAISRRRIGETVEQINQRFPHWFCLNFRKYNGREDALPLDQHMLLGLAAPRPLYVASAEEDIWADPRGEFLSLKGAGPVYELLGRPGLQAEDVPPLEQPLLDAATGYHVRRGRHGITEYDWNQYIAFADRHLP